MKLSELMRNIVADTDRMTGVRILWGITCDSRRIEPGWAVCMHCRYSNRMDINLQKKRCRRVLPWLLPRKTWAYPVSSWWIPPAMCGAHMCANWFGNPADRLHLIGITGTNGKNNNDLHGQDGVGILRLSRGTDRNHTEYDCRPYFAGWSYHSRSL